VRSGVRPVFYADKPRHNIAERSHLARGASHRPLRARLSRSSQKNGSPQGVKRPGKGAPVPKTQRKNAAFLPVAEARGIRGEVGEKELRNE
jgi:hypothetical protein